MYTYFLKIQIGNNFAWFKSLNSSARMAIEEWNTLTNNAGIICGIYKNGLSVGWKD